MEWPDFNNRTFYGPWEWCLETKASYDSPPAPGTGERMGPPSNARLNRGGSWHYVASSARLASRRTNDAGVRGAGLGLRPARTIEPGSVLNR